MNYSNGWFGFHLMFKHDLKRWFILTSVTFYRTIILCFGVWVGCQSPGKSTKSDVPESSQDSLSVAKESKTRTSEKTVVKDARMTEELIREKVQEWLLFQNKGDFESYQTLYAKKFMGVKRSGQRETRFTREGWLLDREKMFGQKFEVNVDDIETLNTKTSGVASFTQFWKSKRFEDKGPKRLSFVLEDGAVKISREEMLESFIVSEKGKRKNTFYFMYEGSLILDQATVPKKRGAILDFKSKEQGEVMVSYASVSESELEDDILAFKNKKIVVNESCAATITGFRLISRVDVHFLTDQDWDCTYDEDDDECKKASDERIGSDLYDLGKKHVVADLDKKCDGNFARLESAPKMVLSEKIDDKKSIQKVKSAFASLPDVLEAAKLTEEGEDWWKSKIKINLFKLPSSGQIIASAYAKDRNDCVNYPSVWQVWELKRKTLIPISQSGLYAPNELIEVLDTDGDGRLDILKSSGLNGPAYDLLRGQKLREKIRFGYNDFDCPC